MAMVIPVESALGRELAKFEQFESSRTSRESSIPPGNPYVYRPFPKMVYLGGKNSDGKWAVVNQRIAADESEWLILQGQGYVQGPDKAIDAAKARDLEVAKAEANLEYEKRHTLKSDGAKAEVEAAIDASAAHISHVPETPIRRKPGRPAKATQE